MDNAVVGLIIVAIILVLTFSFYDSSGSGGMNFSFLSSDEPLASGAGTSEIQNPQPARSENEPGFFGSFPFSPRVAGIQNPPAPATQLSSDHEQGTVTTQRSGYSSLEKIVRIVRVERTSQMLSEEYIILRNGGAFFGSSVKGSVAITGWTVENRIGDKHIIPKALDIPLIDADPTPVALAPGGEAIIVTGTHPMRSSFRENACTGYLNELYTFTPALSNSCADDDPEVSKLLEDTRLSSRCIDFIRAIPECRLTRYATNDEAVLGAACADYANKNYFYSGCVKNFRDSKDFLGTTWRLFLGENKKLFDPLHDRITLRDEKGLVVDVFEY